MNYRLAPESVAGRQTIFRELGEAMGPNSQLKMFQDIAGFSERLRESNNPEIIVMLAVGLGLSVFENRCGQIHLSIQPFLFGDDGVYDVLEL